MGNLLNGLGGLFMAGKETEVEVPKGPSAMDVAMQAAIKERARKGAIDDPTDEPRVTITPSKNRDLFGRRGA